MVALIFLAFYSCSPNEGINNEALVYLKVKDGNFDLYQSDVLGQWETRLTDQLGWDWSPKWLLGQEQLVYYSMDSLGAFFWLKRNLNGSNTDTLPSGLDNPQLSANGEWIYYTESDSSRTNIKRISADLSIDEYLTNTEDYNGRFQLDTDGRQMAFISDRTGTNQLYVMDLKNKSSKQLTEEPMIAKYSAFSPDGQQIAVCMALPADDPKWDIYIIDIEAGELHQVTQTPYSEKEISWSLSGNKIAFHASTEADGDQIYTIDIADGKFTKITSGDHYHGEPTWVQIK